MLTRRAREHEHVVQHPLTADREVCSAEERLDHQLGTAGAVADPERAVVAVAAGEPRDDDVVAAVGEHREQLRPELVALHLALVGVQRSAEDLEEGRRRRRVPVDAQGSDARRRP